MGSHPTRRLGLGGHDRPRGPDVRKSSLSSPRRRLVELMQGVRYGRIEGLAVVEGEPVLALPHRVVRKTKLSTGGGEAPPRPTAEVLKAPVVRLLEEFDSLGDGTVESIEIQDGLPVHMTVAQPHGS